MNLGAKTLEWKCYFNLETEWRWGKRVKCDKATIKYSWIRQIKSKLCWSQKNS